MALTREIQFWTCKYCQKPIDGNRWKHEQACLKVHERKAAIGTKVGRVRNAITNNACISTSVSLPAKLLTTIENKVVAGEYENVSALIVAAVNKLIFTPKTRPVGMSKAAEAEFHRAHVQAAADAKHFREVNDFSKWSFAGDIFYDTIVKGVRGY